MLTPHSERMTYRAAALLALICSLWINASADMVNVLQDDYFYYHVIAAHYLTGQGTAFFPTVQTNGYQPLWQGAVILSLKLSQALGWDALRTSHLLTLFTGYGAVLWLMVRYRQHAAMLKLVLPALVAAVFFFANMGMEAVAIVLAYALFVRELATPSSRPWLAGVGLFVCFLARIDSVLYIAPVAAYVYRHHVRQLATLFACFALLAAAYGAANMLIYGVPVPISGLAKGATSLHLHAITFETLFGSHSNQLIMAMALLATAAMAHSRPQLTRGLILSWLAVVAFYVIHAVRSDYGLWGWYLYPFALHLITTLNWASTDARPEARTPSSSPLALALGLAGLGLMVGWHTWALVVHRQDNPLVNAGRFVAQLAHQEQAHTIAMGDRAGVVAYLSQANTVQLEGLVMDKAFLLNSIAGRKPLGDLFQQYGVELYVATNPSATARPGCYLVAEPSQAQDKQINHEICYPVLGRYKASTGHQTVVFDVRPSGKVSSTPHSAGKADRQSAKADSSV